MKKFFRNFGLLLLFFLVFLSIFVILVALHLHGYAPDPYAVSEFEILCVGYGFLTGLLWSVFIYFIGALVAIILTYIKSKSNKCNHSSKNEVDNK